jgi:hypothetical protein
MQSEAVTESVERGTNCQFGSGVLAANPAHERRARRVHETDDGRVAPMTIGGALRSTFRVITSQTVSA